MIALEYCLSQAGHYHFACAFVLMFFKGGFHQFCLCFSETGRDLIFRLMTLPGEDLESCVSTLTLMQRG